MSSARETSVHKVVADAVRLITRTVGADPSRVALDVPESLRIQARPNELQQVFVNLVKNALEALSERHGEHGGSLTITAGDANRHVWIEVRDDGPGIPSGALGAVFDPFYTTKPPGRGTGLGLNIVYRIVTKYRGTISVESEEGVGTVFQLRFPLESSTDPAG